MTYKCRVVVADKSELIPTAPVDGKCTIVYWDICGLAQSIRMALVLAGADFCDVRINAGSPDSSDYKQVWFNRKPDIGNIMPFPNLPYYMDGNSGVVLSQSNAILKFIGRQNNLLGPIGKEYIVDLALDQLMDLDSSFVHLAYPAGSEALAVWSVDKVPSMLTRWDILLGSQNYLTGDSITIADLKLYEVLRKIRIVEREVCNQTDTSKVGGSTKLAAFMTHIEDVPSLKAYFESSDYLPRPLNNPHAKFK
jgi:glutathione S-transferase